jgi:peptidoglycan/xylan/chitin deacetylase (PgdA/CDA1 family)
VSRLKLKVRRGIDSLAFAAGWREIEPGTLSIVMYHAVSAGNFEDPEQMNVSAARFADHLQTLSEAPLDLLPLSEAVTRMREGALARASATVVFDDGFVGVHDYAAELLAVRRIPATVFVRTAHIGCSSFPEADPALGRPLTWNEVRALHSAGVAIGSHSHSHLRLAALDVAAVRRELRDSRDRISDELGVVPRTFAYPFGSYGTFNAATRQTLVEEGFGSACTTVWGRNLRGDDVMELRRMRVSWVDRPQDLARSLAGCHSWYRVVQRAQHLLAQ